MRIILAIFNDRFEVYGSLKPFFEQYPQYAELKDKIDYTMSRKKSPFEHSDFKLQRLNVRRSLNGASRWAVWCRVGLDTDSLSTGQTEIESREP